MAMIKAPTFAVAGLAEKSTEALVAKPMATPAWGIRAKPRYFLTLGSALEITAPLKAPSHLPTTLETRYKEATMTTVKTASEANIVKSKEAPEMMKKTI